MSGSTISRPQPSSSVGHRELRWAKAIPLRTAPAQRADFNVCTTFHTAPCREYLFEQAFGHGMDRRGPYAAGLRSGSTANCRAALPPIMRRDGSALGDSTVVQLRLYLALTRADGDPF